MKKIQESAKNVQKAIEQGLKKLGVGLEEVDVKILDEGGIFRKAKVELIYADGVEEKAVKEDKNEIKNEIKTDKKESKKADKESLKAEKKALKQEKAIKKEESKEEDVSNQTMESFCTKFLKGLCEKMNIEANISCEKKDDGINFNATGEKVGPLIGKRGETLNAIQELLSNVAKKAGYKDERIFFDVENYKSRRELSLAGLAERMAKKAIKIEKPIRLERMNSYERKIIHTALQEFDGIDTRSEGEEPNRYVVIIPNKRAEKSGFVENVETVKTEEIEENLISSEENVSNKILTVGDENLETPENITSDESSASDDISANEDSPETDEKENPNT